MKKWKKTHRQRIKYKERKLLKICFHDFPKSLYLELKESALFQKISINNLMRKIIREALNKGKYKLCT